MLALGLIRTMESARWCSLTDKRLKRTSGYYATVMGPRLWRGYWNVRSYGDIVQCSPNMELACCLHKKNGRSLSWRPLCNHARWFAGVSLSVGVERPGAARRVARGRLVRSRHGLSDFASRVELVGYFTASRRPSRQAGSDVSRSPLQFRRPVTGLLGGCELSLSGKGEGECRVRDWSSPAIEGLRCLGRSSYSYQSACGFRSLRDNMVAGRGRSRARGKKLRRPPALYADTCSYWRPGFKRYQNVAP